MSNKILIVITTTSTKEEAHSIGLALIKKKLAACIQIDKNITSIYSWKNKIEKDNEYRLLIKTTESNYIQVEQKIKELHHYETPQILAVSAENIETNYSHWITSSLT